MRIAFLGVLFPVLALAGSPLGVLSSGPVTFTMRVSSAMPSLDWTVVSGDNEDLVLKNIMEGLTELGADGKTHPRLAESFTLSPDGRIYTFHLRHGVKWSDGRELTATDFVESWKRLLSPMSPSENADALTMIKGAPEFRRGVLTDFSKTGVQTPDPYTLVVTLTNPSPSFPLLLSLTSAYPVRADLIQKYGKEAFAIEHLVVLGPYLVAEREASRSLRLKRNPTYSGPAPQIEQLRFFIVNDDLTAIQLFKDGKIDLLWTDSAVEAEAPPTGSERRSISGADVVYLGLDVSDYPLNLLPARKAIALAIDRSKVVEALHGPVDASSSLLSTAIFPDVSLAAPAFNVEQARKLWQEAGLLAVPPPSIELLAPEGAMTALVADFVKSQLEANLGLKITVRVVPPADYEQGLTALKGSLFVVSRRAISLDPHEVLDDFISDSRDNHLHWKNAAYDGLISRASVLPAGTERIGLYKKALQLIQWDDAVVVPLYAPRVAYQLNLRFTGFAPNAFGDVFLRNLKLK